MTALAIALCGRLGDLAAPTVTIDLALPMTVGAIRTALAAAHPPLADELASDRIRTCLGDLIVGNDAVVTAGQSLALFPPVSGG